MKPKLLVVDDDGALLAVMKDFFEIQGWDVTGARTGQEGIEAAARTLPEAIVLDVVLPDMKGWDVCRNLREKPATARIPILLMSGARKDDEAVVKGLESGADDYLPKSASLPLVLEKLKTLMRVAPKG